MWKRSLYKIYSLLLFVLLVDCKCPEKWSHFPAENKQSKCVKYFDHPVNFSEAQYICNEIYSGDLLCVNSLNEQKALIQYLHNEVGFKRNPVTWIGGRILGTLKWIDGSEVKFDNFGDDFDANGSEKCTKILSLVAKGKQSTGLWTADNCSLRDSGFVCQVPYVEDRSRGSDSKGHIVDNNMNQALKQLVEQFNLIKELCENQIKLIDKLSNNFQLAVQSLSNRINSDEL